MGRAERSRLTQRARWTAIEAVRRAPHTVQDAVRVAQAVLPGIRQPDSRARDPRWAAVEFVAEFVESEPETVWAFAARWGSHRSADLRAAVGVILLEDLVVAHFDLVFPRLEARVRENERFADALTMIYPSGLDPRRTRKLERLLRQAERRAAAMRRKERRSRRSIRTTG